MGKIKVLIKNNQKEVKIPTGIRLLIRRCCHAVLQSEGLDFDAEVSVTFVSNAEIHELNAKFRNIDRPTDVLSFPLFERSEFEKEEKEPFYALGDIVISAQKAFEQAELYSHSIERELGFLTVHSMFHLLGYDHEEGVLQTSQMREKEEQVLNALGISRDATFVIQEK